MNVRTSFLICLFVAAAACNISDDEPTIGGDADAGGNNSATDGGTDSGNSSNITPGDDAGTTDASDPVDMGDDTDRLVVFDDDYALGVSFVTFGGANNDFQIVDGAGIDGSAALRIRVPGDGYTGGTLVNATPVDLGPYNALRFQVRASQTATFNTTGFGNSSDTTVRQVELRDRSIGDAWSTFTIPIPNSDRVAETAGMFHFAEGSDEGTYDIFVDDIEFVVLDEGTVSLDAASFPTQTASVLASSTTFGPEFNLTAEVEGELRTYVTAPGYFDWTSSDTSVGQVDANGFFTASSPGTTSVTASLGSIQASGEWTVNVIDGPGEAAPQPSVAPANMIAALYSNSYQTVPVDTFRAGFSVAELANIQIDGNDTLLYTALDFVGIEMQGPNSLNIRDAEFLHMDIWTSNAAQFGVKLVDFGDDNAFGGGDDTEAQIDFRSGGGFEQGRWIQLDIPLADFEQGGLRGARSISQIILVGVTAGPGGEPVSGEAVVFVDNIYFYN